MPVFDQIVPSILLKDIARRYLYYYGLISKKTFIPPYKYWRYSASITASIEDRSSGKRHCRLVLEIVNASSPATIFGVKSSSASGAE